jgi:uncharacterized protein YrzB (UPF0473 family)
MENNDNRGEIIVLTDDQGKDVEFEHIDTIELDDQYYVILLPVLDPDDGVVILKFESDDEDCDVLVGVEDDEEAQKVLDVYLASIEDEE